MLRTRFSFNSQHRTITNNNTNLMKGQEGGGSGGGGRGRGRRQPYRATTNEAIPCHSEAENRRYQKPAQQAHVMLSIHQPSNCRSRHPSSSSSGIIFSHHSLPFSSPGRGSRSCSAQAHDHCVAILDPRRMLASLTVV